MTLRDYIERWYYTLWGCRHGKHRMKFSGCMYCGGGGSQQMKFYL
jgi:hypothetical protein